MRLEEATVENLAELSDHDLRGLRERANQLHNAATEWRDSLNKRAIGIHDPIRQDDFLAIYRGIYDECETRKLRTHRTKLDDRLLLKNLRKVDVAGFPPLMVRENVAAITGKFARNPHRAVCAEVWVDEDVFSPDSFDHLEKRLGELLNDETDGNVIISSGVTGLTTPIVPLYDLVLVPKGQTEDLMDVEPLLKRRGSCVRDDLETDIVVDVDEGAPVTDDSQEIHLTQIQKPLPAEHVAKQLPPTQFDDFSGEDDKWPGVSVVYGLKDGKSKVQSIQLSASRFTVAEAGAWLKSHGFKDALEAASVEKTAGFVKNEEMRICGGIVYEKNRIDSQGDFVDSREEIWHAMESHMLGGGGTIKVMHEGDPVSCPILECFVADEDTIKSGEVVPKDAWFITVKVLDDDIWADIKSGKLTGFSMAGNCHVVEMPPVV